jgi:hypothetical protein
MQTQSSYQAQSLGSRPLSSRSRLPHHRLLTTVGGRPITIHHPSRQCQYMGRPPEGVAAGSSSKASAGATFAPFQRPFCFCNKQPVLSLFFNGARLQRSLAQTRSG